MNSKDSPSDRKSTATSPATAASASAASPIDANLLIVYYHLLDNPNCG